MQDATYVVVAEYCERHLCDCVLPPLLIISRGRFVGSEVSIKFATLDVCARPWIIPDLANYVKEYKGILYFPRDKS